MASIMSKVDVPEEQGCPEEVADKGGFVLVGAAWIVRAMEAMSRE
jgi:hypothetical protein